MIDLPPHPGDLAWPTLHWPTGSPDRGVDAETLHALYERAFAQPDELGLTLATVAIHRGVLVAERYAGDVGEHHTGPETTLISWSMAKSMTQALVGMAVGDGRFDPALPAGFAAWRNRDDPRAAITTDQLLRMVSGLSWNEDYVDDGVSNVIEMLFGAGQHDYAAYAAHLPLIAPPGSSFVYSSGSTNLVAKALGDAIGTELMASFVADRLFAPLGMRSAEARFDAAGTFAGSSFVYATARDFAKFGYLYLRDGMWEGERLLPPGWVTRARTLTPQSRVEEVHDYGEHWWLWRDRLGELGAFGAHGYEQQYILVVPACDLVIVRLGKSTAPTHPAVRQWMRDVVGCFAG